MTARDVPPGLRWFFRAVLGVTVSAVAVFLGATWRAETVFDSKQSIGDPAMFNFWNAVATPAIWSARLVWVLGLLVAAYAKLREPHRWAVLRRQIWLAFGLPLGLFVAGTVALALLWF